MEYDEILESIGGFGKYQKALLLLLCIPSIFNAMSTFMLNFILGEHAHRCKIPGLANDVYSPPGEYDVNITSGFYTYNITTCKIENNGTESPCDNYTYDSSIFTATIVSKFDVVCDNRMSRAHVLMAHYIGLLVGSVIGGFVADIFGRKLVLCSSIVMVAISTGLRPWVPTLFAMGVLEFFNGIGSMTSYNAPFLLVTELLGPRKRLFGSFCVYITYCIGNYILLIMAYFLRDWKHLVWTIGLLAALYACTLFFITESPRWLIMKGKTKEAIKILEKVAKTNGKITVLCEDGINLKKEQRLTVSMVYYGIGMNVAKFSGNIFGNFAASSSAETAGVLFSWALTDRVGRKKLLTSALILGGISCLCTIFTKLYATESEAWIMTALAMIGRFCISVGFFLVYLFTAELFPTMLRASSIGFCSMLGRVGAIASAYIGELGTTIQSDFGVSLPLIIFGVFGLVSGIMTLTLPETTKIMLPSTFEKAKELKRSNKKNTGQSHSTELENLTTAKPSD